MPAESKFYACLTRLFVLILCFLPFRCLFATDSNTYETVLNLNKLLESTDQLAGANSFSLEVARKDADSVEREIGTALHYELTSPESCHVTLVRIDSEGLITVRRPPESKLAAGIPMKWPETAAIYEITVPPPTGRAWSSILCTIKPLKLNMVVQDLDLQGFAHVNGLHAEQFLLALKQELDAFGQKYSRFSWTDEIVGRTQGVALMSDDIESYFSITSRNVLTRRLPVDIRFEHDSYLLTEQDKSQLDELAGALNGRLSGKVFRFNGHTDSTGSDSYNQELSENRAKAVTDYLEKVHGVSPSVLLMKGYGEMQPKDTNESQRGRAINRRVEMEEG